MNRRKALLRMGNIMAIGAFAPLIPMIVFSFIFPDSYWIFLVLLIYGIWIWIFGGYINRMFTRINRDYPKEDDNSK